MYHEVKIYYTFKISNITVITLNLFFNLFLKGHGGRGWGFAATPKSVNSVRLQGRVGSVTYLPFSLFYNFLYIV